MTDYARDFRGDASRPSLRPRTTCEDCGTEIVQKKVGAPRVRCAPCVKMHAVEHMRINSNKHRTARIARLRFITDDIKSNTPCKDCGHKFDPVCMDFDHLPEYEKSDGIAKMVWTAATSKERLMEEIAKCDVVCANCHRLRTNRRAKEQYENR